MRNPMAYPLLSDSELPWRMLKTRPGTAGFPGLVIYFSIESRDVCVLEDVHLSDDREDLSLLAMLASEGTLWGMAQGNGKLQY